MGEGVGEEDGVGKVGEEDGVGKVGEEDGVGKVGEEDGVGKVGEEEGVGEEGVGKVGRRRAWERWGRRRESVRSGEKGGRGVGEEVGRTWFVQPGRCHIVTKILFPMPLKKTENYYLHRCTLVNTPRQAQRQHIALNHTRRA